MASEGKEEDEEENRRDSYPHKGQKVDQTKTGQSRK
jgi:hypothetical protein